MAQLRPTHRRTARGALGWEQGATAGEAGESPQESAAHGEGHTLSLSSGCLLSHKHRDPEHDSVRTLRLQVPTLGSLSIWFQFNHANEL